MIRIKNFIIFFKISANVKIPMQWFENFGGGKCPPWLRACPLSPLVTPCSAVRHSGVDLHDTRGVTRLDGVGARNKFGAPILESEVLWKEIYCIEGSICDIVRNFRRPPQPFGAPLSDFGARGIVPPLHPLVTPLNGIVVFVT